MGLDFSKTGTTTASAAASTVENEIEAVMPYDIAADRAQMNAELVDSAEVDAIVSTIEVYNLETIHHIHIRLPQSKALLLPTLSAPCHLSFLSHSALSFSLSLC